MLYHSKMSSLPLVFFFLQSLKMIFLKVMYVYLIKLLWDMSFSSASTKACKQLLLIVPQNTLLYSSLQTNVTFLFHFHSNHDLTFLRTKILFKYNLWFCPMFKCNLTMVSHTNLHICIIYFFWWSIFFLSFIHILDVGGVLIEITYCHTHSYYNL